MVPDSVAPSPAPSPDRSLFREEAVRAHSDPRIEGDVVRVSPRWGEATFWFLGVVAIVGLAFAVFGHVREYATGPAVVRASGQADITVTEPGVIEAVDVASGDRVRAGQVIVRLQSVEERNLQAELQLEFEHALVSLLRDPENQAARADAARLRAELELARSRLEQRLLRAPMDGTVHNLRVRAGQRVESGEPIAAVTSADRRHELVALVPGRFGPVLRRGQKLRLRLDGYAHTHVDLSVEGLGEGVVGPSEVRRDLGPELGDAMVVMQPVILVRAALPGPSFESDGEQHPYVNGLQGTAEVWVADQRILYSVLPWTKSLKEKLHG
jgi:membrane fusion protein (multidrug efflux system)